MWENPETVCRQVGLSEEPDRVKWTFISSGALTVVSSLYAYSISLRIKRL